MRFLRLFVFAIPLVAQDFDIRPVPASPPAAPLLKPMVSPATSAPGRVTQYDLVRSEPQPDASDRRLYKWSVVSLLAANTADIASSWGAVEANPVLAKNRQFDSRSALVKLGFVGASLLLERIALRRNPSAYRKASWMNFAISGGLAGIAYHNVGVR